MRLFSVAFIIILMTFLFGNIINKIETIEQLENQLEHKSFQIDSLKHEIDTLQWENQIWDSSISQSGSGSLLNLFFWL